MFPDAEGRVNTDKKRATLSKKTIAICMAMVLALFVGLLLFILHLSGSAAISVPSSITQKVKSTIYLPAKLPGNYQIEENSFSLVEDEAILIFEAQDGVGAHLFFSEQPRPQKMDFDDFYKNQLSETKTINNVPYPSVWGKSLDGRLALSIVTDDTWIMLTTRASIGNTEMQQIAQSIQKY